MFVSEHSLLVPAHLQELYEMYMRELDERKLDRAMALEKATTRHTIKVGPELIRVSYPNYKNMNEVTQMNCDATKISPLSLPGGLPT